jgi:hypothetical protein
MFRMLSTLFSRIRGVPTGRLLGRSSAGTGRAEALDAAAVRLLLDVRAADQVTDEIASAVATINIPVTSVAGRTGSITLTRADVELSNVDNVSGANAVVSTAQAAADDLRVPYTGASSAVNLGTQTFSTSGAVATGAITASDNITLASGKRIRSNGTFASGLTFVDGFNAGTGFVFAGYNTPDSAALNIYMEGSGEWTLRHRAAGSMSWTNSGVASGGTRDLVLSRAAAGVLQIGTTTPNALGSLNLSSVTASGTVALQNGLSPCELFVSSTFTSATSFERLRIRAQAAANYQIGPAVGSAGGSTARMLEIGYFDAAGTFTANVRMGNAANNTTFLRAVSFNSTVTFFSTFNGTVGTVNLSAGADAADGCCIGVGGSEFFSMDAAFNGNQTWWQGGVIKMTLSNGSLTLSAGKLSLSAATTARAVLNIPSGVAPTSPANGDVWRVGASLFLRDGATTRSITFV